MFKGRRVIVIGEPDGVPGSAIATGVGGRTDKLVGVIHELPLRLSYFATV